MSPALDVRQQLDTGQLDRLSGAEDAESSHALTVDLDDTRRIAGPVPVDLRLGPPAVGGAPVGLVHAWLHTPLCSGRCEHDISEEPHIVHRRRPDRMLRPRRPSFVTAAS
jgi:hypothetical protein